MTMLDISRYSRGDRDAAACAAASLAHKKRQVRKAREGELTEGAGPTRRRLKILHRRMSWYRMSQLLPLTDRGLAYIATGKAKWVRRTSARAIEALYDDYMAEVEADDRRWPVAPLRAAVGSVRALDNTNMRREIYAGGDISTKQAEDYADSLGLLPVEIWEDWYAA